MKPFARKPGRRGDRNGARDEMRGHTMRRDDQNRNHGLKVLLFAVLLGILSLAGACGEDGVAAGAPGSNADAGRDPDTVSAQISTALLDATDGKRALLSLRQRAGVEVDPSLASDAWDVALNGFLLRTNSGASGPGRGGAYGPITDPTFEQISSAAIVPHASAWRSDRVAGPFDGWYLYDKCPAGMHTLASRFHSYGVESGGRRWKLQIIGYYGLVMGAPQAGRYTVRFAEVTAAGSSATQRIADLDASAGGAYLDLVTGTTTVLTESEAASSTAWDVGFRRSAVFLNGGVAGTKGVRGVDLDATRTDADPDVCLMSEASEQARFDAMGSAELAAQGLAWATSEVEGAFGDDWYAYDPVAHAIGPGNGTFIVRAADGATFFKLAVTAIEGASRADAGRVGVRFAPIAAGK